VKYYIIFDLEATCWENRPDSMTQETIEIGAVKLNYYGELESTFCRFIKPVLHPQLSYFCQELTTISQSDVNKASTFPSVIEAFQDWIDIYDEDYLLCSWGQFDARLLRQDCRLHRLEDDWLDYHINLRQQYTDLRRLTRRRGLRAVVEAEGFEFTGQHHRAIDDAINLAKIFVKYLDSWQH